MPESKVKDLSPLPMQNAYSKIFLDVNFLFENRFSFFFFFAAHYYLGVLNNDKIIYV